MMSFVYTSFCPSFSLPGVYMLYFRSAFRVVDHTKNYYEMIVSILSLERDNLCVKSVKAANQIRDVFALSVMQGSYASKVLRYSKLTL
eukprot:scaffold1037_cov144-Skeletonema_menzelii.AAC.6